MKVLSTDGLTKLIQLIKNGFISVDDTVSTNTVTLATVATSGSYNDLSNKPTIPSEVTESTVSGWGFTKNTGTVTSVNNTQPVNGNVTLSIPSEVTESTVSGWGFTKNTGTVTSVNNTQPVNGNVTLSIPDTSNLANKDLSNLSSTGNSKFQAPLVSGTNIKTINNNSILGSGNLTLDGLPSQTGQSGKFLTTDGTDASWATVTIPTPTYDSANERITW